MIDIQNFPENPYLDWIVSGKKKYEGRTADKIERWDLYVGKRIIFVAGEKKLCCEVTELLRFEDFGLMHDALGDVLMPGRTRNEVIRLYNGFYEKDAKYEDGVTSPVIKEKGGALAIGVKVIV